MNLTQQLEQEFSNLPTLNHIGLALMQFAFQLQGTPNIFKDPFGVYCLTDVSFAFNKGEDEFKLYLRNVNIECDAVKEFGFNWCPLKTEGDLAVCEIKSHGQLGQASKYIWIAHHGYLSKRITKDPTAESN